ncbi:MAG: hypothetical protein ACLTG4_06545 [Oscillospiraceae bacterium]
MPPSATCTASAVCCCAGGTVYAWPGCMEGRGFDETGKGRAARGHRRRRRAGGFVPVPGRRYEILRVDVTDADSCRRCSPRCRRRRAIFTASCSRARPIVRTP